MEEDGTIMGLVGGGGGKVLGDKFDCNRCNITEDSLN